MIIVEERKYCIYKHTSPSGLIYIGQTCQNPNYRWRNGNEYKGNPHFTNAIKKYGWNNFKHEILFRNLDKCLADKLEIAYIQYFKNLNICYNITDGGEYNNSFTGHLHTEETKRRISNSIKAKYKDLEYIEKLKSSYRRKPVIQYDQYGVLIKEWESLRDAARNVNTSHSNIRNVCIGKKKSCKGFIWKFK